MEAPDPSPLLDRLVDFARADDRIAAVLLFGSHASGTADAHSDIDTGLVLTDAAFSEMVELRDEVVHALGDALLAADFGEPANVHVINADGTAYELILTRAADLDLGRAYRVLLDKAGVVEAALVRASGGSGSGAGAGAEAETVRQQVMWFWHDLEHVITALARGQWLWAHGGLEEMRGVCLVLARLDAGVEREPDDPYWKVDAVLPTDRREALRATVVPAEPGPMRVAAWALIGLYREVATRLAKAHGIAYPAELDRLLTARLQELQ